MKRVAVMGAHGFVGRNLTEFLQEKYIVFPVTRDNFSFLEEEKVKTFIKENEIDIIINCANVGGSRKNGYAQETPITEDNLRMFFNIENCLLPHMKLINFGSGAQYNKKRDLVKVAEEEIGKVIPEDSYGYSKFVMSKYISKCSNIYHPVIFGLYGKYEDYTFKFISNAIIKNLLRMPITINQNVIFDYLHIDDFLHIIELLLENDYKDKEFNITPMESIDLVSAAEIINCCGGYKSDIIINKAGMNFQYTGANGQLLKMVGGYEFLSYKEGIEKLYQFYLRNIGSLDLEAVRHDTAINHCFIK